MRSAFPLALCAMAGCDLVYGLGDRVEPDAPPGADVLEIDAPPTCNETTATVEAIADATIINESTCNPANRWGASSNVNVGQNGSNGTRSRILLRFALTAEMRDSFRPGGGFTGGSLTLHLKPDVCAAPCNSAAIGIEMYAANNDWNEGQATGYNGVGWCMRKQVGEMSFTQWETPGADGLQDRARNPLGRVQLTAEQAQGNSVTVPLTASDDAVAEIGAWLDGTQLTMLLVPTTGIGTLFVKAHEYPGGGAAELAIRSCR